MNITGQLTWQDYLHAQSLHARPPWWGQLLAGIAVLALIGGYASAMVPDIAAKGWGVIGDYLWLPILIVVAIVVYTLVVLPGRMRRLYEQHKEMQAPFNHEITPSRLVTSNQYERADRPWGDFRKWKENKDILLLYLSEVQFVLIPKRFCSAAQLEALHTQLAQNHVPQVGTVTRRSAITTGVIAFWMIVGGIIYVFTMKPAP